MKNNHFIARNELEGLNNGHLPLMCDIKTTARAGFMRLRVSGTLLFRYHILGEGGCCLNLDHFVRTDIYGSVRVFIVSVTGSRI